MTSHDHSSGSGTSGEEPGTAAPSKLEWGVLLVLVLAAAGGPDGPGGGSESRRDVLADYAAYLRELVDLSGSRPLRVVVDAGLGDVYGSEVNVVSVY